MNTVIRKEMDKKLNLFYLVLPLIILNFISSIGLTNNDEAFQNVISGNLQLEIVTTVIYSAIFIIVLIEIFIAISLISKLIMNIKFMFITKIEKLYVARIIILAPITVGLITLVFPAVINILVLIIGVKY
jgi:hypothetical protein